MLGLIEFRGKISPFEGVRRHDLVDEPLSEPKKVLSSYVPRKQLLRGTKFWHGRRYP